MNLAAYRNQSLDSYKNLVTGFRRPPKQFPIGSPRLKFLKSTIIFGHFPTVSFGFKLSEFVTETLLV